MKTAVAIHQGMSSPRRGRGCKNGAIARAVSVLREQQPLSFSPVWLMERAKISRRQADNAIGYARRLNLIERRGRGEYATVGAPVAA